MQFEQSASVSTAANVPAARVCAHRVVTGPLLGTRGVRWIRPPVLRLTDSSFSCWTPIVTNHGRTAGRLPVSAGSGSLAGRLKSQIRQGCEVRFHLGAKMFESGR